MSYQSLCRRLLYPLGTNRCLSIAILLQLFINVYFKLQLTALSAATEIVINLHDIVDVPTAENSP